MSPGCKETPPLPHFTASPQPCGSRTGSWTGARPGLTQGRGHEHAQPSLPRSTSEQQLLPAPRARWEGAGEAVLTQRVAAKPPPPQPALQRGSQAPRTRIAFRMTGPLSSC